MSKNSLIIEIVDDTGRRDCNADCGVDWSSPDEIDLVNRQVIDRFGDRIRLEYVNLAQSPPDRQEQKWRQTIRDGSLSVPLLIINGQIRIAGRFDIRQVMDAVEAELEMGT